MTHIKQEFFLIDRTELNALMQHVQTIASQVKQIHSDLQQLKGERTDDYITAQQFMDKTHMCRATFDDLRKSQQITVFKTGRKLYLHASAVKEFIEDQEPKPPTHNTLESPESNSQSTEDWITAAEFMKATKMSRSSFNYKRKEGKINVTEKGSRLFLKRDEISNYFNS